MNIHREKIKKVAIVDFDVHHGNGTEETIRWLRPGMDTKEIYTQGMFGEIHTPRFKPWYDINDTDNVLFVSVHGYGPRERGLEQYMPAAAFYPGSGKTVLPSNVVHDNKGAVSSAREVGNSSRMDEAPADVEDDGVQVAGYVRGNDVSQDDEHGDDDDDEDDDDSSFRSESTSSRSDEEDDDLAHTIHTPQYLNGESKMKRMKRIYGDWKKDPQLGQAMPPLILDVGVSLPSVEFVQGEYRHQWRNYFR